MHTAPRAWYSVYYGTLSTRARKRIRAHCPMGILAYARPVKGGGFRMQFRPYDAPRPRGYVPVSY